jgi:hypothetical protein
MVKYDLSRRRGNDRRSGCGINSGFLACPETLCHSEPASSDFLKGHNLILCQLKEIYINVADNCTQA